MAQSLIPVPSTTVPIVPISRRWIAFSVIHKAGARPGLWWTPPPAIGRFLYLARSGPVGLD